MGVELHITRAAFWADNDDARIPSTEWLAYVATDSELQLDPQNGDFFVRWLGESAYDEPWLDWFQGNISTKWPDTALYRKMLAIAAAMGAQVQDDEGTLYSGPDDWNFDPNAKLTRG